MPFTQPEGIKKLFFTELKLVKSLRKYLKAEEEKLMNFKKFLRDYDEIEEKSKKNYKSVVDNPVDSYLLIKRFTTNWREMNTLIRSQSDGFHQLAKQTNNWPTGVDLLTSGTSLTKLQDTYNLNITEITHGKFNGINYGSSLSANDCFELGKQHFR